MHKPDQVITALKQYRKLSLCHVATEVASYYHKIFPFDVDILDQLALSYYDTKQYDKAYDTYSKILAFPNLPEKMAKKAIFNQHYCISHVENRYTHYPEEIVRSIVAKQREKTSDDPVKLTNPKVPVILTITSCKRFFLFEKTINSFLNCCTDLERIDRWICIDDNSSVEDRNKMQELYPFFEFCFKNKAEKGHPQSMNIIQNIIEADKVASPYIFHMEDDWKFIQKRNYITECLEVLSQNPMIGQCLINKNYAETAKDVGIHGGILQSCFSGLRYYIHEHCANEAEQDQFNRKYGPGFNCAYWPYFSFRPSLIRSEIFSELGKFDEKVSHFELQYSYKYREKGYLSAFLEGVYCLHIGRLTSERHDDSKLNAYILNGEKQLHGKEEASTLPYIKTLVINLDRRPDRWEKFLQAKQRSKSTINFIRYPAVDGSKLVPTEQLQRIFDGNDYNMREGMVGCAISHIKIYTEIMSDSDTDIYLILEDDIELCENFDSQISSLCEKLSKVDWDMCYLGHHSWNPVSKVSEDRENPLTIERWDSKKSLQESVGGTIGYLINKKGAEKLLTFLNRVGMINCIDTMQQKSADELQVYYTSPHLVYSDFCPPQKDPNQGSQTTDTDIQHNYRSLTIPYQTRVDKHREFFTSLGCKVIERENLEELEELYTIADRKPKEIIIFYTNPQNIYWVMENCPYPCYPIEYKTLVIVPYPSHNYSGVYFDRLKKGSKWDISDCLVEKPPVVYIPFGDTTHVTEALDTLRLRSKNGFPFDSMDREDLNTVCLLTELVLDMTDTELTNFVTDLCDPEIHPTSFQNFNGKTVLTNNKFRISFPHEDVSELIPVYISRFKNLRDTLLTEKQVILVHCTRWEIDGRKNMDYILCAINKYRGNLPPVRIITVNGVDESGTDTELILHRRVGFPEKFRTEEWTQEKTEYDQKIFRPKIVQPLKEMVSEI